MEVEGEAITYKPLIQFYAFLCHPELGNMTNNPGLRPAALTSIWTDVRQQASLRDWSFGADVSVYSSFGRRICEDGKDRNRRGSKKYTTYSRKERRNSTRGEEGRHIVGRTLDLTVSRSPIYFAVLCEGMRQAWMRDDSDIIRPNYNLVLVER